jgi:hypothetical protein
MSTSADDSDSRQAREQWYAVGGKRLRFAARVFDQERFLQDGLQTGHAVWPCARLLVEYLSAQPAALLQRHCVELGCGMGICGLAAAALGCPRVSLCDGDATVLEHTQVAIAENASSLLGCGIDTAVVRWGDVANDEAVARMFSPVGLVLASDVLYGVKPDQAVITAPLLDARIAHLFALVDRLMDASTLFLLSFENRGDVAFADVLASAAHFGWRHEVVSVQDLFDNETGSSMTDLWMRCVVRLQRLPAAVVYADRARD